MFVQDVYAGADPAFRPRPGSHRRRQARLDRPQRLRRRGRLLRLGDRPPAWAEPDIDRATHCFGTVFENAVLDPETCGIRLDGDPLTDKTGDALSIPIMKNAAASGCGGDPR